MDQTQSFFTDDNRWRKYLKLEPEVSDAFERFAHSLVNANLRVQKLKLELNGSLNPPPPQREGDGFIEIFHIDVTENKERLEKMGDLHAGAFNSMCIVRLPQVVPEQDALCSDTLWVTGHDLSVFAVIRNRLRKAILLGNPGIGKSWWQWQYLLYSMRPDVYRTLVDLFALPDTSQTL